MLVSIYIYNAIAIIAGGSCSMRWVKYIHVLLVLLLKSVVFTIHKKKNSTFYTWIMKYLFRSGSMI